MELDTIYSGLNRNSIEEFYTNPDIAKKCIEILADHLDEDVDIFIEPSAGNGSFSNKLNNCLAYDIQPTGPNIEKCDFLKFAIPNNWRKSNTWTIGNPPFGRQSSLVKKFIKKACEYSSGIAFILPRSFKKESMKKSFNEYYHLIYEWDLPKNSFFIKDKLYDVPCVFQIWKKFFEKRLIKELSITNDFIFIKKNENPDIAFRRVGGNAGNLIIDIENCNVQCFYFLKLNIDIDDFIEKVKKIKWADNSTGPRSISKGELLEKYCELLKIDD